MSPWNKDGPVGTETGRNYQIQIFRENVKKCSGATYVPRKSVSLCKSQTRLRLLPVNSLHTQMKSSSHYIHTVQILLLYITPWHRVSRWGLLYNIYLVDLIVTPLCQGVILHVLVVNSIHEQSVTSWQQLDMYLIYYLSWWHGTG